MGLKQVLPDKKLRIRIKDLNTSSMEIVEKGIKLEFREPNGNRSGDLIITPTKLVWNSGDISKHGRSITWPELFPLIKTRE